MVALVRAGPRGVTGECARMSSEAVVLFRFCRIYFSCLSARVPTQGQLGFLTVNLVKPLYLRIFENRYPLPGLRCARAMEAPTTTIFGWIETRTQGRGKGERGGAAQAE